MLKLKEKELKKFINLDIEAQDFNNDVESIDKNVAEMVEEGTSQGIDQLNEVNNGRRLYDRTRQRGR